MTPLIDQILIGYRQVIGWVLLSLSMAYTSHFLFANPPLSTSTFPIIGGTRLPQTLNLDQRHYGSFGWIHPADAPLEVTCSGVLISPVHFLTAAHCLNPYVHRFFGVGFGLSPDVDDGRVYVQSQFALQHPTLDLAVVRLVHPPTHSIKPLALLPSRWDEFVFHSSPSPTSSDSTELSLNPDPITIESMGYGDRGDPSQARGRYFLELTLGTIEETRFQVYPQGEGGLCFGDSGGPALWQSSLPDEPPYIIGIESTGDPTCQGPDWLTRLDVGREWIEAVLNRETPTVCRVGARYCDGLLLHSCPFGREVISDCPFSSLCKEAQDLLLTDSSLDEMKVEDLKRIKECNREAPSDFWNEDPLFNYPASMDNEEAPSLGETPNLQTGCSSYPSSSHRSHWIGFGLLALFFLVGKAKCGLNRIK